MNRLFYRQFLLFCLLTFSQPGLVAFDEGESISNNMPELSWLPVPCEYYEVWIDGLKMDEIAAHRTSYTCFPLSFGKHSWKVVAIMGDTRLESSTSEFVIDDDPVTNMPDNAMLLRHNWKVRSSALAGMDGALLSLQDVAAADWYTTSLPATVLTVLVRNAVYPNPYTGTNNMLIPDCSDEFNSEHDLLKFSHIPSLLYHAD